MDSMSLTHHPLSTLRKSKSPKSSSSSATILFVPSSSLSRGEIATLKSLLKRAIASSSSSGAIPIRFTRSSSSPTLSHVISSLPSYSSVIASLGTALPSNVIVCRPGWVSECRRASRLVAPSASSLISRCDVDVDSLVQERDKALEMKKLTRKRKRTEALSTESSPPRKRRRLTRRRTEYNSTSGSDDEDDNDTSFSSSGRCVNGHFVDKLSELRDACASAGDSIRETKLRQAIAELLSVPNRIETEAEARGVHRRGIIGPLLLRMLVELIQTGQIRTVLSQIRRSRP